MNIAVMDSEEGTTGVPHLHWHLRKKLGKAKKGKGQ